MTAWVTITASDLEDHQASALVDALRNSALGSDQADPFDTLAAGRIAYIRNRISGRVRVSATPNTVPLELKTCACWLIIQTMMGRLQMNPEKVQQDQIDQAYRDLKIAGTEELPITAADDAVQAEVQTPGAISVVTTPHRQPTRHSMDGL
ncbi:MAG: hypothetical protein PHP44_11075 [Kiritimatiellae bacterium]|nr:hypothetical protein [Kiritimatiellia bacterium]